MKRILFQSNKWRYLLVALMLFTTLPGFAKYPWSKENHTEVRWDEAAGVISIRIVYFDDTGSDLGDKNGGLWDDGWMDLTFGNSKLHITCGQYGENVTVRRDQGTDDYTTQDVGFLPGRDLKAVYIYWQVRQNQIGVEQTVSFKGTWWQRDITKDDPISGSTSITPNYTLGAFTTTTPVVDAGYSDNGTIPVIKIPWSKPSSGSEKTGSIVLCEENGTPVSGVNGTLSIAGGASVTSGTFILNASGANALNLNQSHVCN
jgi:hypothetical protein